jgi:hypothetical protein
MDLQSAPRHHVRPTAERALLWLEGLLAIGAYGGAVALIAGAIDLGEATAKLPFDGSTAFAGFALGLLNGALPTVVLVGALQRRPWAEFGHLAVGVVLVGWIVVQVAILGPPVAFLQVLYLAYGVVIVALAVQLRRTTADDGRSR